MSLRSAGPWALVLLFLALMLPSLNRWRLLDADELTYSQAALECAHDGHWLPPTVEGQPLIDKPPLWLWLGGAMVKTFGPTERALRFWPCVFGALTLFFMVRLAGALGAQGWMALLPALFLWWQRDFLMHARMNSMDASLLACLLGALWGLERHWTEKAALWPVGLWLALAILIKSWFAFTLVPALLLLFWLSPAAHLDRGQALRSMVAPCALALALWLGLYEWALPGFLRHEWQWNVVNRLLGRAPNFDDASLAYLQGFLRAEWSQGSMPTEPLSLTERGRFYLMLAKSVSPVATGLLPALLVAGWRQAQGGDRLARFVLSLALTWMLGLGLVGAPVIHYLLPLTAYSCLFVPAWLNEKGRGLWVLLQALVAVALGFGLLPLSALSLLAVLVLSWLPRLKFFLPELSLSAAFLILGVAILNGASTWWQPPNPNQEAAQVALENPSKKPMEALISGQMYKRTMRFYGGYSTISSPSAEPSLPRLVVHEGRLKLERPQ